MFIISEAKVEDIPLIIQIAEDTWWPTYGHILTSPQIRYMLDTIYAPQTLEKQISKGQQTYLILKDDFGGQGFASYGQRPEDPESYKIHKLYVLPRNQGKGYGRALVDEIRRRAGYKDKRRLELNVNRNNPAIRFYESCGFKIVREEDVPIGPYWMNDYVMMIEL